MRFVMINVMLRLIDKTRRVSASAIADSGTTTYIGRIRNLHKIFYTTLKVTITNPFCWTMMKGNNAGPGRPPFYGGISTSV